MKRQELADYLHSFLACDAFQDYAPNGLQVEGKEDIYTICTAVTASLDAIEKASSLQADALLVHHGYFWRNENPLIVGMKKTRLAFLLRQKMNLFAYHLPLDCHRELGNNISLAKVLDFSALESFTVSRVPHLLWIATLPEAQSASSLQAHLQAKLGRLPLHIPGSERPIKRIAFCTGAAQDYIEEASHYQADAYISGEVSEKTYYQARELGIDYFACGHHATERFGIQALGEHLAALYSLQHHFIDSQNPV